MRSIVEPARTASRQSPDMPMESVLPPIRANVLAASSNARRITSRSSVSGPIAMTPSSRKPAWPRSVSASPSALRRRTAETFGRRDVELQEHRKLFAGLVRRLRERRAGLGAIDALYQVERSRHRCGFIRLKMADEVLSNRRQARETSGVPPEGNSRRDHSAPRRSPQRLLPTVCRFEIPTSVTLAGSRPQRRASSSIALRSAR